MTEQDKPAAKKSNNTKWVIFIIVALLLGGAMGYAYGKNTTDAAWQTKYDQQTQQYESQTAEAKAKASGTVEEGQQTLESLQAENAELKSTIAAQNQKIADLEKQLEEAKESDTTTTTPPTTN